MAPLHDGDAVIGEESPWVARVLQFWFAETDPANWFHGGTEFDERVRTEFAALHAELAAGLAREPASARALLAAIIVADQFPRNMFRGLPQAFATDSLACAWSERLVALGLDSQLTPAQRYFAYLPLEHSEDRQRQALATRLIESLGNESWTRHAREHADVIRRFGRFPHRNRILGRTSTDEEMAYLAKRRDSWGQSASTPAGAKADTSSLAGGTAPKR